MRGRRSGMIWTGILLVYLTIFAIPPVYAYIDAGSGSFLFQILIGGLLGAAVAVKAFWRRIWAFFTRRPSRRVPQPLGPPARED
jgi:hypothetical protein